MPIRAIVFDFDGVVVDSEPLYQQAERLLFRNYGVEVPDTDWKLFQGTSEQAFLELARQRYGIRAPVAELRRVGRALLRDQFQRGLSYIPGFRRFYAEIRTQYATGLVTSTSRSFLHWIYANTAVVDHFEVIVTADDVRHTKPHPEPYRLICRLLRTKPGETLVIEDSVNGVRAAVASGTVTVGFLSHARCAELAEAHFCARNYAAVRPILTMLDPD